MATATQRKRRLVRRQKHQSLTRPNRLEARRNALRNLGRDEVRAIAKNIGVKNVSTFTKTALVNAILQKEFQSA